MNKWREVRLGDIATINMGQSPKSQYYNSVGEGLKFLQGNRTFGRLYPSYDTYTSKITKIAEKGDILISVRAPVGDLNLCNDRICIGRGVTGIRSNEKNLFLFYNLIYNTASLKTAENGTTYGSINKSDLENFKLLIPDLKTQEKIADVLSTYDELIENNNRRIEILEKTAEEIYKEWFVRMRFPGYENTKFVKGIPEGWETVKLENICKLVRGISYSTKEIEKDEGIPMLTLKSVKAYGGYNYDGLRFFDGKIAERHYLKENDLIMAITDMTQDRRVIGQVCLIPKTSHKELVFSADLILLDELKINKDYMYGLLRYGGLSDHIAMFSNGANVLHLNQRVLNKIRITLASETLRRQYQSEHELIQNQISVLEKQNKNLIKQRDLLLPRLMNGTIEVK